MRRIAFVIPRFGSGHMGGAESLCGELAARCAALGDTVEILTTCAQDNRTWENVYTAGTEQWRNVTVRRFPVSERNLDIWVPLQIMISQHRPLSVDEQLEWMRHSVVSLDLFAWIQKHGSEYDVLIFAPYLFGTTYWGAQIHPERSVLLPCLHDEAYAYLDIMVNLFTKVRGCIFNASAEQRLCQRLYGRIPGGVVGMGFPELSFPLRLQRLHERPYILYLGRKETGKNVHLLIDLFLWYVQASGNQNLDLLIVGGGEYKDLHRSHHPRIRDIAHVTEQEKNELCRDALVLAQPSTNESFSIVMMEAWRVGTPCLVHGACSVTREHVENSRGGLFFLDEIDFYAAIEALIKSPELARELGERGRKYVLEEYNWDAVMVRFARVYNQIIQDSNLNPIIHEPVQPVR